MIWVNRLPTRHVKNKNCFDQLEEYSKEIIAGNTSIFEQVQPLFDTEKNTAPNNYRHAFFSSKLGYA